ncbi:unnamed protein product [Rotaria socialis]
MSNLEKLTLYLLIKCQERFIDGNALKKNIVSHMPKLNDFVFNIRSTISLGNQMKIFNLHQQIGHCHIYTYPYTMIHYDNLTNNFSDGLFQCVQTVKLFDERPFEHTFFMRISQAFPFLKYLTVSNWQPQNGKQHQKFNDNNQDFPIIEYPHLIRLHLLHIHYDYAE